MKPDRGTNVVSIAGTETKLAGSCNNNVVYIVYRQKKKTVHSICFSRLYTLQVQNSIKL